MKRRIIPATVTALVLLVAAGALAFLLGDVNHDGFVRAEDARLTLRFAAGLSVPDTFDKDLADYNSDGDVRANDARNILRLAAGLAEENPTVPVSQTDTPDVQGIGSSSAVAWANWTDNEKIWDKAVNSASKYNVYNCPLNCSIQNVPVFRFTSENDVAAFRKEFAGILEFDRGLDETPSFDDTVRIYDGAFFEKRDVLMCYVAASSGSFRYGVENVYLNDADVCMIKLTKLNDPECFDCMMAGWFVFVSVDKADISSAAGFDAVLTVNTRPADVASYAEGNFVVTAVNGTLLTLNKFTADGKDVEKLVYSCNYGSLGSSDMTISVGDVVYICYDPEIAETYPLQLTPYAIKPV